MNLHRFDVNTIKNVAYVAKHSKQHKTTKVIKLRQFASIWRQNDQKFWVTSQNIPNNAKLQKWSYYDEFPSIWRQNDKNVELRRKTFKTTLNYKSNQITMTCIDLMSKTSKQRKTTNTIKLQWIASIWRHNDQKCWVTSQCIQNKAKLQKWSYNDEFASISCQNDQNNSKLQKRSNYNELHRFDVITIKNVELRRNAFKTTQNYKSNQITMTCIYLMSKHWKQPKTKIVIILRWICIYLMSNRSKMLSYVSMHSKQHKTTKVIKLQWLASIGRRNNKKCWVTSQNIQTNAKLQNWSN